MNALIRLIVIEQESHPDVKFEVFERLNLGAEKLNDQELRNSVYRGKYNDLLRDLTHNQHMLKVMRAKESHKRMIDRQLILRFFAMWRNTHLKYKGPMKLFLSREMENNRRYYASKKDNPRGYWETRKLNVALWDTLLYSFSFHEKSQIIPLADSIREEFLDVITNDDTFIEYISSTTDKPERIQYRADTWRQRLQGLVSNREPRAFSLDLKQRLHQADPTCKLCNQRIHDIDDAEVDHIEHYWRGGKTIPDNARLTHRYCNRARGGRD